MMQFLACFLSAGLLAFSLNWLALIPWRRAVETHWTERARKLFPVRAAAILNVWIIPANCTLAAGLLFPETTSNWVIVALVSWLGTLLGTYPFDREIFPSLKFRAWLRRTIAAWLLMYARWTVFVVVLWAMPQDFGWESWSLAAAAFLFQVWLIWGLGIRLAQMLRVLKPAPERLQRIVSETAALLGVSVRAVWMLDSTVSYAAASPATRELIFSDRLLELHPDDEIAAICIHELGHLNESWLTLAGRVIGSLLFFPWLFTRPVFHSFEEIGIAMLLSATAVLMVFGRQLSRKMEVRADQIATEHERVAGTYARALERLYQTNQIPAVMADNRKTHPHLYDRLLAAGVTPEYPRPAAPERMAWSGIVCGVALGILLGIALAQ